MHLGFRRIEQTSQQEDPDWFVALRRGGADLAADVAVDDRGESRASFV